MYRKNTESTAETDHIVRPKSTSQSVTLVSFYITKFIFFRFLVRSLERRLYDTQETYVQQLTVNDLKISKDNYIKFKHNL